MFCVKFFRGIRCTWDISKHFRARNFRKYFRGRLKPPVPGSTPGNRFPWDVTDLFKTHKFFIVLHQIVQECHAIAALALPLATVTTNRCGAMHFHHSTMTHQSGDSCLPFNIRLRAIKHDTKKPLSTLLRSSPGRVSMKLSLPWKPISGLIPIKEAVISNPASADDHYCRPCNTNST